MGIFDSFKKSTPPATPPQPAPAITGSAAASDGGFGAKLRQGLKRTWKSLNTDVRDLFKSEGRLVDDAFLEDLLEILIKTDMGVAAATQITDKVRTDFRARVVQMEDILNTIRQELKGLMAQDASPIQMAASGPTIIMVVGVNGSGKTTSIAKLTYLFTSQDKKVVLGAGDTFRAAAVDQLKIWAGRLGAEIVTAETGKDPASVAYRAVARAVEIGADVCIIDTAGRLQTQHNLMQELEKIRRSINKVVPEAPHEVLLVLDATGGQNGISQARGFTTAVNCTGIVLAKIDGTAKGGVVIPIRQQFNLPVKYVGVGERAEDVALFQPETFVDALFEGLASS